MTPVAFLIANAADILLMAASFFAAVFCLVLSRRLTKLSRIDNGLGGAIAVLSAQVDDMQKTLQQTRSDTASSADRLASLNREARRVAEELELVLATCHDLDKATTAEPPGQGAAPDRPGEVALFGTRRQTQVPEVEESDATTPIPLFLKTRFRVQETG